MVKLLFISTSVRLIPVDFDFVELRFASVQLAIIWFFDIFVIMICK